MLRGERRSSRPNDAASQSPVSAPVHAAKGKITTQEHVMVRAGRRRVRLRVPQADVWKGFAISADLRVRSSVNTHRTQEHRVKRSMRTHPSSGLISTRLVPRMTAKPSERVLGGTAGRPVSGSIIGATHKRVSFVSGPGAADLGRAHRPKSPRYRPSPS